ncbi:MAG: SDR family NAD(P)-dependent oxidoreductase [Planctomycetia bacterium]|nr:SDR family NAD(P)-dependent oxidoreductase [Planctomycetia bacterium]
MKENWKNKVVLITGGSSGFGRMIAEGFARRGARIVLAALEKDLLEQATEEMRGAGSEVLPVLANITKQEDVDRIFASVMDHYGQLDVLVNAAGRTHRGRIEQIPPEDFQALFDLNVLGTIRCTQAAIPHLLKTKGHVVNIGSLASKSASRWTGAYPVSKFAVAAFSQQLRLELGPEGIHVLLVCPGPIKRDNPRLYKLPEGESLPQEALQPGAGVKVGKIDPVQLTEKIIRACEKRKPELVVPWKARILFAIAQLFPSLGDWIVRKKTS